MTVKEAALEVLRAAGRPLSVAEILGGIEAGNLFQFATAGKRGVVLAARTALAKQPPASLESVRRQAKASEEWRKRQPDGKSDA